MGSTKPLKNDKKKDFCLFERNLLSGRTVAKPSGKFCMAIPTANITAAMMFACDEIAVPIENPTASPSGML